MSYRHLLHLELARNSSAPSQPISSSTFIGPPIPLSSDNRQSSRDASTARQDSLPSPVVSSDIALPSVTVAPLDGAHSAKDFHSSCSSHPAVLASSCADLQPSSAALSVAGSSHLSDSLPLHTSQQSGAPPSVLPTLSPHSSTLTSLGPVSSVARAVSDPGTSGIIPDAAYRALQEKVATLESRVVILEKQYTEEAKRRFDLAFCVHIMFFLSFSKLAYYLCRRVLQEALEQLRSQQLKERLTEAQDRVRLLENQLREETRVRAEQQERIERRLKALEVVCTAPAPALSTEPAPAGAPTAPSATTVFAPNRSTPTAPAGPGPHLLTSSRPVSLSLFNNLRGVTS